MQHNYLVYILASQRNGTLYIGVTNNLERRLYEHKQGVLSGFSETYKVHLLVYIEQTENVDDALQREKQLKHWGRKWKLAIIEKHNPEWCDLSEKW